MSEEACANLSMPNEVTKKESPAPARKQFGFVVAQSVTHSTPLPEIEKSINNFFDEMGSIVAKTCHIKKAAIETGIHYNGRKKILEGQCFIPQATNENVIDSLYYQGKAIWRSQPTEPHSFSLFINDEGDCSDYDDDMDDIG